MRIRAAMIVAVLVACSIPVPAIAGETSGSVEPTSPIEFTAPVELPGSAPVPTLEDPGPVGVWLSLGSGAGTDSRQNGVAEDASEVRWVFELRGAPAGTEFRVWAQFATLGEIEAVGTDRVVVVTPAHDVLTDAYGHCVVSSADMVVTIELASVEVVAAPAAEPVPEPAVEPAPDAIAPVSAAPVASTTEGEPFLPFTGADDRLPFLAALFAAAGLMLRRQHLRPTT